MRGQFLPRDTAGMSTSSVPLAKWTQEQTRPVSSAQRGAPGAGGGRRWAQSEKSRVTVYPESSAEGTLE